MKRAIEICLISILIISSAGCFEDDIPKQCFLRYDLNGIPQEYYGGTGMKGDSTTEYHFVWSNDIDRWVYLYFPIKSTSVGTYTNTDSIRVKMDYDTEINDYWSEKPDFIITITKWEAGEYADTVTGTFSGTITKGTATMTVTNGRFEAWYYSSL